MGKRQRLKRCRLILSFSCCWIKVKMKVFFALSVLAVVFKDSTSMPMLGGMSALPPSYVRSAVFENTMAGPVTVEVTFDSKNKQTHYIEAGKSVNVEGTIDHGSWSAVDKIVSFKIVSPSNGEKEVPVSSPGGVEIHKYSIGVGAANGLQVTKTLM